MESQLVQEAAVQLAHHQPLHGEGLAGEGARGAEHDRAALVLAAVRALGGGGGADVLDRGLVDDRGRDGGGDVAVGDLGEVVEAGNCGRGGRVQRQGGGLRLLRCRCCCRRGRVAGVVGVGVGGAYAVGVV